MQQKTFSFTEEQLALRQWQAPDPHNSASLSLQNKREGRRKASTHRFDSGTLRAARKGCTEKYARQAEQRARNRSFVSPIRWRSDESLTPSRRINKRVSGSPRRSSRRGSMPASAYGSYRSDLRRGPRPTPSAPLSDNARQISPSSTSLLPSLCRKSALSRQNHTASLGRRQNTALFF